MICAICNGEHAANEQCGTFVREASGGTQMSQPLPPSGPVPTEVDPLIGATLGSFKVVKRLGKGGMGSVYLGEQTVIGSRVAIKVLHEHLASNPALVSRFYAEARAVNLIGHENIVNIFDMNVAPPARYFLVMEYLEGRPLQAMTKTAVEPTVAIPILIQVCNALEAAHAHGVIHRDLKPENVFLTRRAGIDNFVKILDFGIAKLFATEARSEQTSAGVIIGTPEYMAPEQAVGERPDGRADLYSLGIIGYLLSTGLLPFTGGGVTSILLAHRDQVPKPPRAVNPLVPQKWSDAIVKALAKRPEDRYQSAAEFRVALERALEQAKHPVASTVNAAVALGPLVVPKVDLKLTATPHPLDSRHTATFEAQWVRPGNPPLQLKCMDMSRGGVFLCFDGKLPAIFSRVNLVLSVLDGPLPCTGEVVRHVTADQAKAWGMSAGFGVQFVDNDPKFKAAVAQIVQGLPRIPATAPKPAPAPEDDPAAEPRIDYYRKRINGDHYVLLALEQDAELSDVRQRVREAKRDLDELKAGRLSQQQLAQVTTALHKIEEAGDVLGHAAKRVSYDANRGNFRGVARCIAAGVTVTELEGLREDFLAAHPGGDGKAHVHFTAGAAWEAKGALPMAMGEFEQALAADPLNIHLQQRYWALKRRMPADPPRS